MNGSGRMFEPCEVPGKKERLAVVGSQGFIDAVAKQQAMI